MKQTTDFDRKCSEDILAALQKNRESIDCIHKLISCKEPHTRNNMAFGHCLGTAEVNKQNWKPFIVQNNRNGH